MSFRPYYTPGATQPPQNQTPLFGAKSVQCKSFKIDIAAGNPFLTATAYTVGYLPKEAQIVSSMIFTQTAVSGGTVSAATLSVTVGGGTVINAQNVFANGGALGTSIIYYTNNVNSEVTSDQVVAYTPTLTGAGATAGVIYINLLYVI